MTDILVQAEAAFNDVLADAATFAPTAEALVQQARDSRADEALVVALRAYAWSQHEMLRNETAKHLLDEAARVARRRHLDGRLAEVLVSRAAVQQELGHVEAAQHDLDEAARMVPPDRRGELLLQQGALLQNKGMLREAERAYRAVVGDPSVPDFVRAKVANNLAHLEADLGRTRAALSYIDLAIRLGSDLGPTLAAYFAETKAWVTIRSGRLTDGLALFEQARDLYVKAGLHLGDHLNELADALADLRLVPEALAASTAASDEFSRHHAPLMAGEAQLRVARLTLLSGDPDGARTAALRAAALLRRQHRPAWVARAVVVAHEAAAQLEGLSARQLRSLRGCAETLERHGLVSDAVEAHLAAGRAAASRGRSALAVDSLRRAQELARPAPVLVRLRGRLAAALAADLAGDPAGVVEQSRRGLADLERHRAALASMELRALASGHGAELGALGLRAIVPSRSPARVFGWLERTRAAALLAVQAPAPDEATGAELAALRTLHAELDAAQRESGQEPAELLARIAATEHRIRRASWARPGHPTATGVGRGPGLAELRERLGPAVLVEYGQLGDTLLAAVLTTRAVRLVDLGPAGPVGPLVDTLLFAVRRLTRPGTAARAATAARASATDALTRLRTHLLSPVRVPADAPLVVVPVGELQRIPWPALHDGPTTVAPSAAFWAGTATAAAPAGPVALLAGPDLPGAVAEVGVLRAIYPDATVLVPPHSTATAALAAIRGGALAHLACHGRIRVDNPTFSALQLSDGPLTVHELGSGPHAPRRIVLAACDSAVQVSYPGEESLGFVSALLARGTTGVLASAVPVPDLDAVPLMRTLHQHLRAGTTLAHALHHARAHLDPDTPTGYVNQCAFNAYGAG